MTIKRRSFIKNSAFSITGYAMLRNLAFDNLAMNPNMKMSKELKISLAQWSLHRSFNDGTLDPNKFAAISKQTYGIDALEYVNQFYMKSGEDEKFWLDMKKRAEDQEVKSLLIMVDNEGDLGVSKKRERIKSVKNHYKWVNAAKLLGCHSIRVNAFGNKNKELFRSAIVDGMGRLSEYAQQEGINVIIENHGLFSSDGALISEIIQEVNMPNFGTFPDFGNWCTSAKWGSTMRQCSEVYDPAKGVSEFLPFAKAVSAKSYDFDENGNQSIIDYPKLLKIIKESAYDGFIGVEYEGDNLSEHDGIIATKKLMERVWEEI